MQKKNKSLYAVVITYNEEKNIRTCLESIKWVDKIVIVDSFSSDKTINISKEYTNQIYQKKFDNDFSYARNFGLSKSNSDWILILDADETVPKHASKIINKLIQNNKIDGYWFARKNYINDKCYLKYGYFFPDYQLRLFRNLRKYKYFGKIHEQLIIPLSKTLKVNSVIIHHNYSHTKYDSWLSFYRFFKYIRIEGKINAKSEINILFLFIKGFSEMIKHFYHSFIIDKGYKDGYKGFRAATLYSIYQKSIYCYSIFLRIKNKL